MAIVPHTRRLPRCYFPSFQRQLKLLCRSPPISASNPETPWHQHQVLSQNLQAPIITSVSRFPSFQTTKSSDSSENSLRGVNSSRLRQLQSAGKITTRPSSSARKTGSSPLGAVLSSSTMHPANCGMKLLILDFTSPRRGSCARPSQTSSHMPQASPDGISLPGKEQKQ
ncbi:hypothetical protein DL98DRAFT_507895 [Cadophora sp. DSE1049]|nr:hypothetical protein DL98DRAFT_507895 [Cadophora sp. DSE1049]